MASNILHLVTALLTLAVGIYLSAANEPEPRLDAETEGDSCPSPGIWNSAELVCYTQEYCATRYPEHNTYLDVETGRCTRILGGYCDDAALSCPPNAVCRVGRTGDVRCDCREGYVKGLSNRVCLVERLYGEECVNSQGGDPCSKKAGLQCRDGTCGCEGSEGARVFDSITRRCGVRPGDQCQESEDECTRNAECKYNRHAYANGRFGASVCSCKEGFSVSLEKTHISRCLSSFQGACERSVDCPASTSCIDGVCQCRGGISQLYDTTTSTCQTSIGQRCVFTTNEQLITSTCEEHSHCNGTSGICECEAGYAQTPDFKCSFIPLNYGDSCLASQCDATHHLACVDGECSCVDDLAMTYNGTELGCVSKLGSRCGELQLSCLGGDNSTCTTSTLSCEPGLLCKENRCGNA